MSPNNRPRVVLADDHALIIDGLRNLLEPEFEIAGSARDGEALVALVAEIKPDLAVLDITMPKLSGLDAARRIQTVSPDTRIVFLTMHASPAYVRGAFEAGASGYVLKSGAGTELLEALRVIGEGCRYVAPEIGADALSARPSGLSTRETEVLQWIARGKTAKEIGGLIHVSTKTVEFHKYNIMAKLGRRSTAELTRYAIEQGILRDEP